MARIGMANFGDLSEKKTVFIEFLEIIQNKEWEVELLRVKLSELIFISGSAGGFISNHCSDHMRSFLVGLVSRLVLSIIQNVLTQFCSFLSWFAGYMGALFS